MIFLDPADLAQMSIQEDLSPRERALIEQVQRCWEIIRRLNLEILALRIEDE